MVVFSLLAPFLRKLQCNNNTVLYAVQYSTVSLPVASFQPIIGGLTFATRTGRTIALPSEKTLHIVTVTIMVNDSTTISISDMSSNITWLKIKVRYYA